MKINVRWFEFDKDLETLTAIDAKAFEEYWSQHEFSRRLKEKSVTCLIAEYENETIGFLVYELFLHRFSVVRIGVVPSYRRKGVGSRLLKELKDKLTNKRGLISAEVRETNLPVQLFLSSQGYKAVEVLHDYYPDSGEDSYVFHYRTA